MKEIEIHTDGSSLGNPGPGGYAAILIYGEHELVVSGSSKHATNNEMELIAAIEGIKRVKEPCAIWLYSDSNYLVKGAKEWLQGWKKKNWKTTSGPVKNRHLWEELDKLMHTKGHDIEFMWVKAHAGHPLNERCDTIARNEAQKMK